VLSPRGISGKNHEGAPPLSFPFLERQGGEVGVEVHPSQCSVGLPLYPHPVPWGLKRFQQTRNLHFITFSCYDRAPLLGTPEARRVFEQTLENVRQWYALYVTGYVVMPEHVHLLISEPEGGTLAIAIQMLKQIAAHQLKATADALRESPLRMTE